MQCGAEPSRECNGEQLPCQPGGIRCIFPGTCTHIQYTGPESLFNSFPGGYIKKDIDRPFKFILTSVPEEKGGGGEWTHMCKFYFYELIWSVYLKIVNVVKM